MCVFVPNVYCPKWVHGKEVLTHWPQSSVAWIQSKDGLTVQLLYYSVGYKASPLATSVTPPLNKQGKNKTHARKKKEVDFGSQPLIAALIL